MKILITGASGFIGSHLLQALLHAGHDVTACVRNKYALQQRWPNITVVEADFSRDHEEDDWLPRLNGIDVVINAVGIIRETGRQTFDALHTQAPCALFRAGKKAGVKRIIQISALGADDTATSQYHLSKRAADECLTGLDVDWAILMPSIVYGPGASSMNFFKAMAALPVIPLIGAGDQPVQPIYIDDLVKALLQIIDQDKTHQLRIEMPGPDALTMKDIYIALRQWLNMGKARFINLPYRLSIFAARIGGFIKASPLTIETIEMLRKGNTGDVEPFVRKFGFKPISFKESLLRAPAQQSDQWYAGLYFLRPLLRLAIALLWIFTGLVSAFVFPPEQSYAMLEMVGITGIWALLMLYGAAATDLVLGIATLLVYRLPLVGLVQISVIMAYSIIISIYLPEHWLHPFGAVSKNLPLIVATLIMIVLERRR